MTWSLGWGTWHTSDVIAQTCPQGCSRKHTVAQAAKLNEAASVKRKEGLRIAHERWLADGKTDTSGTLSST